MDELRLRKGLDHCLVSQPLDRLTTKMILKDTGKDQLESAPVEIRMKMALLKLSVFCVRDPKVAMNEAELVGLQRLCLDLASLESQLPSINQKTASRPIVRHVQRLISKCGGGSTLREDTRQLVSHFVAVCDSTSCQSCSRNSEGTRGDTGPPTRTVNGRLVRKRPLKFSSPSRSKRRIQSEENDDSSDDQLESKLDSPARNLRNSAKNPKAPEKVSTAVASPAAGRSSNSRVSRSPEEKLYALDSSSEDEPVRDRRSRVLRGRSVDMANAGRARVPFSRVEEEKLKEGVRRFGLNWVRVLDFGYGVFHAKRTNVHLKDKWRNLTRHHPRLPIGHPLHAGSGSDDSSLL